MELKWIGAALIVAGSGSWGLLLAAGYKRQETMLRRLCRILQMMQWELRYRLTSLPELCRLAAGDCSGMLKDLFLDLARELDWNTQPDAHACMASVLKRYDTLPPKVRKLLRQLGKTLGRFDLEGQLEGMNSVTEACREELEDLGKDRDLRLRSCRTLTLCTGFALVILFL